MERTLAIIKPDGIKNAGNIISMIQEDENTCITDMKMIKLTIEQARILYEEHKERDNFEELVSYMSSAHIIAMILQGSDIIKRHRINIKHIRHVYADHGSYSPPISPNLMRNAIHGSDSVESAEREIKLIFG
jgi:nucleoside-diphosphate kinase